MNAILAKLARTTPLGSDFGLLVVRLWFGGAMTSMHGWGKLMSIGDFITKVGEKGVPVPWLLGPLAGASELLGGALIVLGAFTRIASTFALTTMAVAVFHIHAADPFARKELAICYGVAYLALLIAGPGRFSVDGRIIARRGSGVDEASGGEAKAAVPSESEAP